MSDYGPAYPKINTLFKRDPDRRNVVIPGDWATPEFAYLADCPWSWTEKVDGTNIRLHWDGGRVTVGGRTDTAQIPARLLVALTPHLDPDRWTLAFGSEPATVYGEGYGAGIQKGGQYRPDQGVILFDVLVGRWWLRRGDIKDVAGKLGLGVVPLLAYNWTLREVWAEVGSPVLKSAWPGARIEGYVGRPKVDLFDRRGERLLAKIKVKDYVDRLRLAPG